MGENKKSPKLEKAKGKKQIYKFVQIEKLKKALAKYGIYTKEQLISDKKDGTFKYQMFGFSCSIKKVSIQDDI